MSSSSPFLSLPLSFPLSLPLSLLLLLLLTLAAGTETTTGMAQEEGMGTMTIVAIVGGSILALAVLVAVAILVIRWRNKRKAYEKREIAILEALPNLKLTRTIEEPEVHSVERAVHAEPERKEMFDKNKRPLPSSDIPQPSKETSKESTNPSKESTNPNKETTTPNKEKTEKKASRISISSIPPSDLIQIRRIEKISN